MAEKTIEELERRTCYCGEVTAEHLDKEVSLCGWVASNRDHGGVAFVDLRDHTGIVQVVFEAKFGKLLRPEQIVSVRGLVRKRPADTVNPNLPTGELEVLAQGQTHSSQHKTPVFLPDDKETGEEARLTHRILHLRSRNMQHNLRLRHRMLQAIRKTLEEQRFLEVETPILTLATPEGARDYLVPSRTQQGSFYALPQSPQLFKQMLMAGGIDRYYQVARCFRDEDLRAGRQPEFTQIDLEMSFVIAKDVMTAGESMVRAAFAAGELELGEVPELCYDDAMRRFGIDAPHLGIDLELVDIKDAVQGCDFKVFAKPASQDGSRVVALPVPEGAKLSRKQIDELTEFAQKLGAGGLAWMKIDEPGRGAAGVSSPIAKFLGDKVVDDIIERTKAEAGDVIFFGAGDAKAVNDYMGPVRVRLGEIMNIIKPGLCPIWITEFPLFEYDASTDKLHSMHHPFTNVHPNYALPSRKEQSKGVKKEQLKGVKSQAYDLVINGVELGGGSIRIHDAVLQSDVLGLLGIEEEEEERKFGFLLETLRIGAPRHGGLAFGFDRMVAMAAGAESLRDVIAFPKTQSGQCPLTKAPQPADEEQLYELGLGPKPKKPK